MTEIRTIRHEEGEAFLEVLCDVFSLDYERAVDVFFSEPMFDLNRKWALFDGPQIVSILTTSPLTFGWGRAFGIAGVATRKNRQGEGLASQLLRRVLREGERNGETAAMLFAREIGLYERNGFELLDRVIRAEVVTDDNLDGPILEGEEIELIYNNWANGHPDRLRRDAKRWSYWKWNYRIATDFAGGYVCHEPGSLREAIYTPGPISLPLSPQTEWFGTTFMTDQFEIPVVNPSVELYLMGRNVPGIPQLFMTDQF
jgi:predicted N-acetyltransferase YhbS